jgi:hypothetical protein
MKMSDSKVVDKSNESKTTKETVISTEVTDILVSTDTDEEFENAKTTDILHCKVSLINAVNKLVAAKTDEEIEKAQKMVNFYINKLVRCKLYYNGSSLYYK